MACREADRGRSFAEQMMAPYSQPARGRTRQCHRQKDLPAAGHQAGDAGSAELTGLWLIFPVPWEIAGNNQQFGAIEAEPWALNYLGSGLFSRKFPKHETGKIIQRNREFCCASSVLDSREQDGCLPLSRPLNPAKSRISKRKPKRRTLLRLKCLEIDESISRNIQ